MPLKAPLKSQQTKDNLHLTHKPLYYVSKWIQRRVLHSLYLRDIINQRIKYEKKGARNGQILYVDLYYIYRCNLSDFLWLWKAEEINSLVYIDNKIFIYECIIGENNIELLRPLFSGPNSQHSSKSVAA